MRITRAEKEARHGFEAEARVTSPACEFYWEPECDSTMDEAKCLVRQGVALPFLYGVDFQRSGRGRKGHAWEHVGNSLAITIALDSFIHAHACTGLSLVVGMSIVKVLHRYGIELQLKWPNDLLDSESYKKIGGILVELIEFEQQQVPLVGVGLNFGDTPKDVPEAGALQIEASGPTFAGELTAGLLTDVESFRESGFAPLRNEFIKCLAFVGESIEFFVGDEHHEGVFKGISAEGWLVVEEDGQEQAYHTAEYLRRREHVAGI